MQWFQFVAGALILLFGRPLYWALVAVLGFLIGFQVVGELALTDSDGLRAILAIGAGILAAILAVAFQWLAFGLVGFLAGSYLVQEAMIRYAIASDHRSVWIVLGGILGGVLALLLVDWAVIVLSALAGAMMISGEVHVQPELRLMILLALTLIGITFQGNRLKIDRKQKKLS